MSIVAIVQARMGASRLPNKMMLYLHGYPIVEWVYRRVLLSRKIEQILFALPKTKENDCLAAYLERIGAKVFRGSETDLVGRYYQAAQHVFADKVVRICADNPLICASEIDRLIDYFEHNACDYAYNHIPRHNTYPDGMGAEICQMSLLEDIHANASGVVCREHVFNYIWENDSRYVISTFDPPKELEYPELKLDIDTSEDYSKMLERPYRIDMDEGMIIRTALIDMPSI